MITRAEYDFALANSAYFELIEDHVEVLPNKLKIILAASDKDLLLQVTVVRPFIKSLEFSEVQDMLTVTKSKLKSLPFPTK